MNERSELIHELVQLGYADTTANYLAEYVVGDDLITNIGNVHNLARVIHAVYDEAYSEGREDAHEDGVKDALRI